jgi:two-component system sensor histidine kinase GlrK
MSSGSRHGSRFLLPMMPFRATAAIIATRCARAGAGALGEAAGGGVSCTRRSEGPGIVGPNDYSGRPKSLVYYPRSFLKFILLGFLLVSLPLLYALVELIVSLDRLGTQSQQAVLQAAQAGRASRQLYEQATTLERLVRQHLILDDPQLVDDYARLRQDFHQTTQQLQQLPLERAQLTQLEKLTDTENRLFALLKAPRRPPSASTALAQGYADMSASAQAMLTASNRLTEREIERLQETAAQGRKTWGYLALAAGAIALVLAILFAVLIARPIRQLDMAIRQMGTADFTHAIEVNGPQDMRYLGQRLEWLRTRLHELEEQQTRFLRHVSHELKTPLTAVREGAELLRDRVGGELSPAQQEIVRIVRENTLQLQKLIEDLLTYHQTRNIEPQTLGPVALGDVLRRVVREHKLAALARMITFDTKVKPSVVVGDAEKIRAIVDNLVSNAIKYSPRSGLISLELDIEGGNATLDVIDQGPGIDPEERPRIFESFYQGKPAPEGRIKGSGLGLAIASEYAIAHGGRIEVLDRLDGKRGAHFRLWLPLAATDQPAAERSAAQISLQEDG